MTALATDAQIIGLFFDLAKVVAGGILAAGITLWVSGRRQDKERHRAARHLAIRIIDIFERYALECVETIQKNLNSHRDNPYDYDGIAVLPELSGLPDDDGGWRGLEPSFAIEAQTFGSQIRTGRSFIFGVSEYGDAEDIEEEVNKQAVALGASAWELAKALRSTYLLPEASPAFDVVGVFTAENERLKKIASERAVANAEFWAEQIAAEETSGVPK